MQRFFYSPRHGCTASRLHLHIRNNRAEISLDTSGGALHRRGYREETGPAPMQETVAASMAQRVAASYCSAANHKMPVSGASTNGSGFFSSITLSFAVVCDIPEVIIQAFNIRPVECLKSEDLIVVFGSEKDVESANPDFERLKKLDLRGVIITATSNRYDFVARFFAPKYGILEDPVTGSAYTQLAPYWESKMGPKRFRVKQVSSRGGELTCEVVGDRVFISGKGVKYMDGEIVIAFNNPSDNPEKIGIR